ncbi:HAMP domain-containing sensor histidine kinase [Nonomuraea rosea]|uniref:histidine kinase n=1 Tax=Nonomuraea rosea TaxID=638574 RepID=A0ABP7A5X1_9ACTN
MRLRARLWSTTARLVVTNVMLVALVGCLITVATTWALHRALLNRLDADTSEAALRTAAVALARPASYLTGDLAAGAPWTETGIQPTRTVTGYFHGTSEGGETITAQGRSQRLSGAVLEMLRGVPIDRQVHTVVLPGYGRYRVMAAAAGPARVVTGLPTAGVDETVDIMVGSATIFTVLGVALAGAGASVLVRRRMRPLREVAGTARQVAALPLDTGQIALTARVPRHLTDERTEAGQVGAALNTLLGHIERALDSRYRSEQQVRRFVADASHELRTPLTTILGYAELGRHAPTTDSELLREAMTKVDVEAARMSRMVEDLLLLARLDAGRPLEHAEVDLTRLVVEAVQDAHVVAPGHRWTLDLLAEPVTVTGDALRLHQVITNLLANARQHTPESTTVIASVRRNGENVTVTVADDGPGIPGDLQVFDRFTRGDHARTRASGGAGLGLPLARAIAEAHHGTLEVASHPGLTRFTLSLTTRTSHRVV